MSENLNLKQADRKIFTTSLNDGLLDIFMASVVLMFVIAPFLSVYLGDFWSSFIFLPVWGILYLVIRWLRVHVIRPRIGTVKYGLMRKKKLTAFSILMLILNILFMLLGLIAFAMPNMPGWRVVMPFSGMLLISFSLAGYYLDLTRLYVYGLILALAPVIGEWLWQNVGVSHHGYPVTFGLSALIIFLVGIFKFITLLRDNPLPVDAQPLGESNG
jgi:hypothetical protein